MASLTAADIAALDAAFSAALRRDFPSGVLPENFSIATALNQSVSGDVLTVTGTAPVAVTSGQNPVVSIVAATDSVPGSMSAADKTKLDTFSISNPTVGDVLVWNGTNWVVSGPGVYLIPATANVVTQVNAYDLNNSTAKTGPAWTIHGTVPYNAPIGPWAPAGLAAASVGPFTSATNWLSQTSGPMDALITGPWTVAMLVKAPTVASNAFIQVGATSTNGWYLQQAGSGSGQLYFVNGQSNVAVASTANSFVVGALNVIIVGVDASGNAFAKLNNGTTATGTSISLTTGATSVGLGSSSTGSLAFTGDICELMASTDVPSTAAFNALYAAIVANGG